MDSFLVQVWVPADGTPAPDGDLRGVVRHVASGVETPFHGDEQVLRLLRRAARRGPLTPPGAQPDREKENRE